MAKQDQKPPGLADDLREIVTRLDTEVPATSEREIHSQVLEVVNARRNAGQALELSHEAELSAFNYLEDASAETCNWGTYHGPISVIPHGEGFVEIPSLAAVNSNWLDYWESRSLESKHPLLRYRYSSLVWDFTSEVKSESAGIEIARVLLHAVIDLLSGKLITRPMSASKKLARAVGLAVATKSGSELDALVRVGIEYEGTTLDPTHPGTWGYCFDLFVGNRKIPLDEVLEKRLIGDLENILAATVEVAPESEFARDPFSAEYAARRLAKYYRKAERQEDVKRVLRAYGDALTPVALKATAIQGSTWLKAVYELYTEFGLKEEAENAAVQMRDTGARVAEEMRPASHEMTIENEDLKNFVDEMTTGSVEETATRIASHFQPSKKQASGLLQEIAESSPLYSLAGQSIVDADGREIVAVGSVKEDPAGRLALLISQNMQIESVFLGSTLEGFVSRLEPSPEQLADHLLSSPLFNPKRRHVLISGFGSYLARDFISALHVLVPQIEAAIRALVQQCGRSTWRPNRHGGMNVRPLDDLLRDECVEHVLGEDRTLYLRILLTDAKGWNLRNTVCHGLIDVPQESLLVDRVLHVLFMLAMIRSGESDPNG